MHKIAKVAPVTAAPAHPDPSSLAPDDALRLLDAAQELSRARDLPSVMRVLERAARELTGSEGATFVVRKGSQTAPHAAEQAAAPLLTVAVRLDGEGAEAGA